MENKIKDLIFATGVPGSRWTKVFTMIYKSPEINDSEKDNCPFYVKHYKDYSDLRVGNHSGAYFGPGNLYGNKFDDLSSMSKDEFIEECIKPFTSPWDGRKMIIKSHWFAYNLEWLQENFPDNIITFCYSPLQEAFKWWHLCGGWDITYPDYSWYGTDERIIEGISTETALLKDFMKKKNLDFVYNFEDFCEQLGLNGDWPNPSLDTEVPVAVYNPSHLRNQSVDITEIYNKADKLVQDVLYKGKYNMDDILGENVSVEK